MHVIEKHKEVVPDCFEINCKKITTKKKVAECNSDLLNWPRKSSWISCIQNNLVCLCVVFVGRRPSISFDSYWLNPCVKY